MLEEKEIQKAEKKVLSISLRIAKEKQKIAGECFKILRIAAIKINQSFDEKKITDKIYKEIKDIDNEKIKKLFELKGAAKKKAENKIIEKIIDILK